MTGKRRDDGGEDEAARLVREADRRRQERTEEGKRLDDLEAKVARAEAAAQEVLRRLDKRDEDGPPKAFHWPDLEPDVRQSRWASLRQWLAEVYVPDYPTDAAALHSCWWEHPDLFQVVTVTWRAWIAAYKHDRGTVLDQLRWQHEWRPKCTEYAAGVMGRCREAHVDPDDEGDDVTPRSELVLGTVPNQFPH